MGFVMVFEGALGRITANLAMADDVAEEELATELWAALLDGVSEQDLESVTGVLPLAEEAVVWRVVAHRLERMLGQEGLIAVKGGRSQSGVAAMHPAVEGYAKARERYRKVMKELFERLGGGKGGSGLGLPDIAKPIIEKGEGVLEDALEFEARKKSTQRKRVSKRRG